MIAHAVTKQIRFTKLKLNTRVATLRGSPSGEHNYNIVFSTT